MFLLLLKTFGCLSSLISRGSVTAGYLGDTGDKCDTGDLTSTTGEDDTETGGDNTRGDDV